MTKLFSAQWFIDPAGYRIGSRPNMFDQMIPSTEEAATADMLLKKLGAHPGDDERWILPNSGRRAPYKMTEIDALYRRLGDVHTEQQALDFCNKFGLLYKPLPPFPEGISVSEFLRVAEIMRDLQDLARSAETDKMRALTWLLENFENCTRLTLNVERNSLSGEPEMFFEPETLGDWCGVQFIYDTIHGTQLRECKFCNEYFRYGSGTSRRSHAMYCSPKCQAADAYNKRTKPKRERLQKRKGKQ